MEKMNVCFETLKRQCKEQGMDPACIPVFKGTLGEEELKDKQSQHKKFLKVVNHFFKKFISSMCGVPLLTAMSDDEGYIIQILGDESMKETVTRLGIKEGVRYTEENSGISSISLALKYNQPIEIIGTDHYHDCLSLSSCYSVPVTDPVEQKTVGTITFMTAVDQSSPLLLTLLLTMKDSIERELKLLTQNEKLHSINQLIMDTTRNGMMIADENGRVIGFNHAAERITCLREEELLFQPVSQLSYFGSYLQKVLAENEQYTDLEISFQQKDGQLVTVLFDALPILNKKQQLIGAFAQIKDITERKKTEEWLLNAEKLSVVGQMAASVAHEIRNPLTTIRGFIQLTAEAVKEKTHFRLILDEIDRINFIVSEFLILSKPNVVHFHTYNVKQILEETIALFQVQGSMNNTQVVTEFADDEMIVHCDANQLKQVFINLFKNSMEAMPFGGQLAVHVEKTGDKEVAIQIIDKGEGMNGKQIEMLGTPFYTTKETGTGLGYMIVKRIIEQHNGTLSIYSKVNEGTSVEIKLPLHAHQNE